VGPAAKVAAHWADYSAADKDAAYADAEMNAFYRARIAAEELARAQALGDVAAALALARPRGRSASPRRL